MSNQGPGAQGRGGFGGQAGRGRGGSNFMTTQYPHQPQMGGFPPNTPQFRNQPNAGRGGMPPPFQGQGRPQYPNSPHQAARSPALSNAMPGTPNMNQSMPIPAQGQYQNYYNPQIQNPAVNSPSTSAIHDSSNRGGKAENWRQNEQSSESRGSSEQSKELFGHSYTACEQMPLASYGYGHKNKNNAANNLERSESGNCLPPTQRDTPSHPDVSEPRRTLIDHETISSLPFLPPIIPCNLPPSPSASFSSLAGMDLNDLMRKQLDVPLEGKSFAQFLTERQNYGYPPQSYDRMGMPPMGQPGIMYPQMQNMQHMYMGQPMPPSPQPNFQQPTAYMTGQYGNQAPNMSRNSSQMSEHRPASSMGGGPATPSVTPSQHTTQPKPSPAPNSAFSRPPRKSAAIVIKRPDGEALDVESLKAPASPAPRDRAKTPPVIASAPTPPPKPATPIHNRTDSSIGKTKADVEARQLAFKESIRAAAQGTSSEVKAADDAKAAVDAKAKAEADAKEKSKLAEEAKAKEESEAKAVAERKKQEEEEEMERQIQEMEEAEARREKEEQEMNEKRAAEKKAARRCRGGEEESQRCGGRCQTP